MTAAGLHAGDWRGFDDEALASLFAPEVTRHLTEDFAQVGSSHEARAFLTTLEEAASLCALYDDVGGMGLVILTENGAQRHLGFVLVKRVWGRGIAGYLIEAVQQGLRLHHPDAVLCAGACSDNAASIRVLMRAGFAECDQDAQTRMFQWRPPKA